MESLIPTPWELPESAPEEILRPLARWKRIETNEATLPSNTVHAASVTTSHDTSNNTVHFQNIVPSLKGSRLIEDIRDGVLYKLASRIGDTPGPPPAAEPEPTRKRKREDEPSLEEQMARLYPPKELYKVKAAHITSSKQWHPTIPPTQRYHPLMRQPVDQPPRYNDAGLTKQTAGKVPHVTVLDYLADVMRNKHWRGTLNNMISSFPSKNHDTWPRTLYSHIARMIASNPFLLRLSQMLEGRFYEAACRNLDYVPAVIVHGRVNKSAPLEPQYIAAILIQALGRENPIPCSFCAGDWNSPKSVSQAGNDNDDGEFEIRPFQTCVSLYSIALPPRFAACANHFWQAGIVDCSCVNLTAPIHPDERYAYIFDTFSPNAANYMYVKTLVRDQFLQMVPTVPDGFVAFGPFLVRTDVVRNPGLFDYGLDLLQGLLEFQRSSGREVDERGDDEKGFREALERM